MKINRIINIFALIILISLFLFTPFSNYKRVVIIGIVMGVWLLSSLFIGGKAIKKALPLFLLLLIMMLIEYVYCSSSGGVYKFRRFFTQYLLTYMWGIIGVYYAYSIDLFKKSIPYIVVIISISCIFTIIGNIAYPGASRSLAGSEVEGSQTYSVLQSMHIGGYDFIYAVVFAIFPCALWIKNRLDYRFCSVVFLILLFGTLLVGSYFTSILLGVVALIITMSSAKRIPRFILFLGVLTIIVLIFKNTILQALVDFGAYIDSPMLQVRAQEMLDGSYQEEYDASGDLSRIDRMYNAFYNISQNPIFGRMFGTPEHVRISGHSELLGYFERYGLFGFVFLYFYYSIFKKISALFVTKDKKLMMRFYVALFFIFLTINTFDIANATGCMVFLIAPCVLLFIEARMDERTPQG